MNDNINLTVTTGQATFQAKLEKVDKPSSETVTIGGKYYRLSGDITNHHFAQGLLIKIS